VLSGQIVSVDAQGEVPTVRILFKTLTLVQERALVKMLFCRPGQWQHRNTPGEVRSIWILLQTLMKPRLFFERDLQVRAVSLLQG
jgi:cellulose synthase (UDP-forming)